MNDQQQAVVSQLETQIAELKKALAESQAQRQATARHLALSQQLSQLYAGSRANTNLAQQLSEVIKSVFNLQTASILFVDSAGQPNQPQPQLTTEPGQDELADQSLLGQASQTRQLVSRPALDPEQPLNGTHPDIAELALPLLKGEQLIAIIHLQVGPGERLDPLDIEFLQSQASLMAQALVYSRNDAAAISERDKANLMVEISLALSAVLDFESITSTAVGFAKRLEASAGHIHLLFDTGQLYFKSTYPERNNLADIEQQALVRRSLSEGLEAWVLETGQPALVTDTLHDYRWLPIQPYDQPEPARSLICSPITIERGRGRGAISFVQHRPNHFSEPDLALLQAIAVQISVALENTILLNDLQENLHETQLAIELSQQLVAATSLESVYAALVEGAMQIGPDRCVLQLGDDLDANNLPRFSDIVFVRDVDRTLNEAELGLRFALARYPALDQVVRSKGTLVIPDIDRHENLTEEDRQFFSRFNTRSLAIIPLVTRTRVLGLLSIEYRSFHHFDEHELALYHTLSNQTIVAIQNARQREQTEIALAETQTLYRAGRVLAGTTHLEDILNEALIEFLYSLYLDQGGIILLSPDKRQGELVAYVQDGQIQAHFAPIKLAVSADIPYQEILLAGQPFTSFEAMTDPQLADYHNFNPDRPLKSLLQAPMIILGETIGWIGADSVREYRNFSQREIDLARAMADQIAITIQNRRLLGTSERQAEQLKAVAQVGKSVSQLFDLDEILSSTVELIRDKFGFYHVSIFLIDEGREWAVVRASTGQVGKIMVERPHRLPVGGQSIVGYVTGQGEPRIALDVGEDKVHFNNPLLPDTRSELALPLISRGTVIGALDVQSVEANAFNLDDVETLQIMADQLTVALENASLFEKIARTLERTQSLYRVSHALTTASDPQSASETVLGEYLRLLGLNQGSFILLDRTGTISQAQARFVKGQAITPTFKLPVQDDLVFQQLLNNPTPLVIHDTKNHPLLKSSRTTAEPSLAEAMLYIPVTVQGKVVGALVADAVEANHTFSQEDIEVGEVIAGQLSVRLEGWQLLLEAQHNSTLLKTAAEISRAASSILDVDHLIDSSVNLIRNEFDLYYVGLFMVDATKKWAILRAGTGEAGRFQIEAGHRLKIGGGSMIGWSVQHREPRIALDVGAESEHFKRNKYLPDTRSELALPLISHDEVIGALTVQSVERNAFSVDDITVLQTMADQLANAIANARLFENVARSRQEAEAHLRETIALQQLSQSLSRTIHVNEILEVVFQACTKVIGFDYVQISLVDSQDRIKAVAGVGVSETHLNQANQPLASQDIMADIIRTGKTEIITGWDERFNQTLYQAEGHAEWVRLFTPISLRQRNVGIIEAGFNKGKQATIEESQVRLLKAFIDQMVLALDNAQRYEISQRTARREAIIREISGKIRGAVDIDDILKTTVSELGQLLGTSQGGIRLTVAEDDPSISPAATEPVESP